MKKEVVPYKRTVQYYETDRMGMTHHANYIHWMEEARIDLMNQLGFPYADMETSETEGRSFPFRCFEMMGRPFPSRERFLSFVPEAQHGDVVELFCVAREAVHGVVHVMDQLFRLRVRSEQYGSLRD